MKILRRLIWGILTLCFSFLIFLSSCKKDDPIATYTVSDFEVFSDDYTMGGNLTILYSSDGENYSSEIPTLPVGSTLWMKLNNGSEDLTSDLFDFEWEIGGETFLTEEIQVEVIKQVTGQVSVSDKLTLITSHRKSGQFYEMDETNGNLTALFIATIDGLTLTSTRAFTYHPTQRLFYVSEDSKAGGKLYTINPNNLTATIINDNDGSDNSGTAAEWDAVVNWYVSEDDSLLAIGDFNGDAYDGFVKFSTDGFRGIPQVVNMCCGMGMLYNSGDNYFFVGNGWNFDDNLVTIDKISISDGSILESLQINSFNGFEDDFSQEWVTLKALAKSKQGKVYGILYASSFYKTYFVSVDMDQKIITHISTMGDNSLDLYNTLALVPKYTL